MLAQLGRLDEAEAAATIGLGLPDDQQRSFTYRRRGWLRLRLERPAEAVEDLIEAVALAAGTPGLEAHVALTRVELARGYLMTGRPLEAAETGEEALPVLDGTPDLADQLADVRGLLIQAYRALGELESALTKVRELLAAAPPDAHPGWLGMVREDEGLLLQQLDRVEPAVDAFLAAASSYEAAEQHVDQVQAVRLAAQSARDLGDFDRAVELLERTRPVLDALPSADQLTLFQAAGLDWDLAWIALRRGETDAAVRHASQAAELYERGGYEDMHISARLLVAEHGTTDETLVEQIFTALPSGHELWHRAGWLLVDRLNAQGRTQEATALEARLTE
jgi:cellulose synthase operon protein C